MLLVTRGGGERRFLIPRRNEQNPNVLIYARSVDTDAIQKVQDGIACITAKMTAGFTVIFCPFRWWQT